MTGVKLISSGEAYLSANGIQVSATNIEHEINTKKTLLAAKMTNTIAHAYALRQEQAGFFRSLLGTKPITTPHVIKGSETLEQGHQVASWLSARAVSEFVTLKVAVVDDTRSFIANPDVLAVARNGYELDDLYSSSLLDPSAELDLLDASIATVGEIFKAVDAQFALGTAA
ncbi:MAG TPA: hypothetical protein VLF79_02650 [Candidatus Saccharimonadales bacterium]|nr:hypothetical protein [Candidatus Saccharimonadales bacterium]